MNYKEMYKAACKRVAEATDAIDTAEEGADLTELRTALDETLAEADRCKANMETADLAVTVRERHQVVEEVATPAANPTILGMDQKEVGSYSLLRAINAAASGNWKGAELEREASEAVATRLKRTPKGFFVPGDVQAEKRDLTVGAPTAGGNLVATDLLSASFIDLLRAKLVTRAAGATVLTGLVGDIAIPKQTGAASAYWVSEGNDVTESQQTIGQVPLSPKTVGTYTEISRKLLKQSSIAIENFVRADLAAVLALAIDLAGLHGTGLNNQPTGVSATSSVGEVIADLAAIAWSDIVDLESDVAIANADVGALAYICNASMRGQLKQTQKVTGEAEFIWDTRNNNTPLNGYGAFVTNQATTLMFGNWADLLIGEWGGLDILVNPYTKSKSGTVEIDVLQDVDVAVRHPESFSVVVDSGS